MEKLKEILLKVQKGELSVDEAVNFLKYLPYEDLGFAKVDHPLPMSCHLFQCPY